MLAENIKIFLINLDRSPDRLANAVKNLNAVGLPFERIPAVDGSKLDMENMESFAVKAAIEKNKWITPPAIGCSLSHYSAYKSLLASDAEWGVVMEDDVEFSKDIVDVLNSAVDVVNKTDIFLLYFHGDEKSFCSPAKINVNSKYSFYPASTLWGGYSTGGYLIHRDVARRLHEYVFPVHISADSYGVFHQDGAIDGLWALLPPISRTSNFGSDISYSKVGSVLRKIEAINFSLLTRLIRGLRRVLKTTDTKYRVVETIPAWLSNRKKVVE